MGHDYLAELNELYERLNALYRVGRASRQDVYHLSTRIVGLRDGIVILEEITKAINKTGGGDV